MSWLDGFLAAYNTVQSAGSALVQRQTINFVGLTVTDDPTNQRTTVTSTALSAPTGTGFVHVTSGTVDGAAVDIDLAADVTGVLPVGQLGHGTAGQILTTNASATVPVWSTCSGDVTASTATPGQMSVVSLTGAAGVCNVLCAAITFADGVTAKISQDASGGTATPFTVRAADGDSDGANLILSSGGGGSTGEVHLQTADVDALVLTTAVASFTTSLAFGAGNLTWGRLSSKPTLSQDACTSDVAPKDLSIGAQAAWASAATNVDGGITHIRGGNPTSAGTTGKRGGVRLEFADNAIPMVEVAEVGVGRRVTALNQTSGTAGVTSTQVSGTGSDGVTFIWDAHAVPGGNPVGGYLLYSEAGALKGVGASGTHTTMGPAEPHCPVCGSDFGHEWTNEKWGTLTVCMKCLTDELGDRPWIRRS